MKSLFKKKQKLKPEVYTYHYFKQKRGIRKYYFKDYNYKRLPKNKQLYRLYFFSITISFAIISILGIINNPQMSMKITFLIGAIGFLLIGTSVLIIGFLRSIYVFFIYLAIIVLDITLYQNIIESSNQTLILFTILIHFIIIAIISHIIKKDFVTKKVTILNYFYKKEGFLGIDLALYDFNPIENYQYLFKIKIDISRDYNADYLNNFDSDFINFCEKNQYIFIAHKSLSKEQYYEIYICTKENDSTYEKINSFIKSILKYNFQIETMKDNVWDYYLNHLYPDDYTFLRENTKNFVERLENDNFDFTIEYPLCFLMQFNNIKDALKCKKNYKKFGYSKTIDFPEDNNKGHFIAVELKTRLGLQRCLKLTKDAYDYAAKYNGLMLEWRIGELAKEEEMK